MSEAMEGVGAIISSVGSYARRVIVGVWFPGILLFGELAFLYFRATQPAKTSLLVNIIAMDHLVTPPWLRIAILIGAFSAAIGLGYVARDISFWISDGWLRLKIPPARSVEDILAQIRLIHGNKVDTVLSEYRPFSSLTRSEITSQLPRSPEAYIREYCKLWLSQKAPAFSTEGIETEINMDVGLLLPLFLAALIFLFMAGGSTGLIFGALLLAFSVFRLYRINWARNIETEIVIVNFLFVHWEGLTKPAQS